MAGPAWHGISINAVEDKPARDNFRAINLYLRSVSKSLAGGTETVPGEGLPGEAYVILGSSGGLSQARTLAVAAPVTLSDGGAGGSVTIGASLTTPALVLGASAAPGSAASLIRSDATIEAFDATDPAPVGLAAVVGSAAKAARRDHVHKIGTGSPDGSKFLRDDLVWTAAGGGNGGAEGGEPDLTFGTANAVGSAETHILTDATIAIFDDSGAPLKPDAAGVDGTNAFASRNDHVHPYPHDMMTTAGTFFLGYTDDGTNSTLAQAWPAGGDFTINPFDNQSLFMCTSDSKLLRIGSTAGEDKDKVHIQNTSAISRASACNFTILNRHTGANTAMHAFKAFVNASNVAGEGIGIANPILSVAHGVGNKGMTEMLGTESRFTWQSVDSGASSICVLGVGFKLVAVNHSTGSGKWTTTIGFEEEAQPDYVTNAWGIKTADPAAFEAQAASGDRVANHVLTLTQNSGGGAAGAHIFMNDKGGDPPGPAAGEWWRNADKIKFQDSIGTRVTMWEGYGGIHGFDEMDEITIGGVGIANKAQITTFDTNDSAVGTTPDHTNDHITIDRAGKYFVAASMHVESVGAGAADTVGMGIFKNDGATLFENVHGHRKLAGGGGDIGSMTISGIVTLAATDTVEVWCWNEDNIRNIVIDDITLSVYRVGD